VNGIKDLDRYCLKLLTNWYGLKDAGLNWYNYLKASLIARGFKQSEIDLCLFTRGSLMIVIYVDVVLIASKLKCSMEKVLKSLKEGTDIDSG